MDVLSLSPLWTVKGLDQCPLLVCLAHWRCHNPRVLLTDIQLVTTSPQMTCRRDGLWALLRPVQAKLPVQTLSFSCRANPEELALRRAGHAHRDPICQQRWRLGKTKNAEGLVLCWMNIVAQLREAEHSPAVNKQRRALQRIALPRAFYPAPGCSREAGLLSLP